MFCTCALPETYGPGACQGCVRDNNYHGVFRGYQHKEDNIWKYSRPQKITEKYGNDGKLVERIIE